MIHFSSTFIAIAATAFSLGQAAPVTEGTVSTGLCSGNYVKSEIPLWTGAPQRSDAALVWDATDDNKWSKEMSAVTNSIMGLKRLVNQNTGQDHWDYIPRIIFGAPADYTNLDSHQQGADAAKRSSPMARVNGGRTTAYVNLNLFPLSEKPLSLCVEFPISEDSEPAVTPPLTQEAQAAPSSTEDSQSTPSSTQDVQPIQTSFPNTTERRKRQEPKQNPVVWFKALMAAFDHDDVKSRLKKNPLFTDDLKPDTPLASMAFLEMMTGLPARYVWRQRDGTTVAGTADAETQTQLADVTALGDWLFKDGAKANWNPTVMFNVDTGLRVVRPYDDLTGVTLEDSRAKGPDDFVGTDEAGEAGDRKRTIQELWDNAFVWAVQLKSDSFNPVDTVKAARNTKDGEFTAYFTEA